MSPKAKEKITEYRHVITAVLVMMALALFCFVAQLSLLIPLVLLFMGIHLVHLGKAQVKLFINLGLLLALLLFAVQLSLRQGISPYYIPVASIGIFTILLFKDLQLAFMMSFGASVLAALAIPGQYLPLMATYFLGSLTGVYMMRHSRTRLEHLYAGFLVGFIQLVCVVMFQPSLDFLFTPAFVPQYVQPCMFNGFICVGLVTFTLKIFESGFGVLTNFSLLELSDFNHPLLKRMVLEAPGTYHHSLIVSNLSEAAANAIDANALLARVGAYYHDVGKLNKPEYFTENQMVSGNKHENLEPSMSRLVILNHVKEGAELARKYKLNPAIVDFIVQHHGTSLIYYFYQRALEAADHDEKVDEQTFRYPGPKPQIRETAIVLLADSVEGAVRALDEQTPARIDEVVRKIINNKFIDGQLDECMLTLKDLERIGETFTRVLSAMYHSRIKYPEKNNGNGNSNKKSSEKSPSQSQPPHASRKNNPAS